MRRFCRSQNYWNRWNSKRHGVIKSIDVAPGDCFERLPYPHTLGPRCVCHPERGSENGIPVYVHDHPLTEAAR